MRASAEYEGGTVKTIRERQDEARRRKLEDVRRKIASGSLVIRQMTADERAQFPPHPQERKRP